MGEYWHGPNGRQIKLGVMDDARYVRREEVERLARSDARPEGETEACLNDPNTLYRFSWPDEDGTTDRDIERGRRDMFRSCVFSLDEDADILGITHDAVTVAVLVHPRESGYGVNRQVPCPAADCQTWGGTGSPIVRLVGERFGGPRGQRTVFECGYCGKSFSVPPEDWERFSRHIPALLRDRCKPSGVEVLDEA